MFKPKGKFGWYELMTSDTAAAGKFYSDVVGWTTKEMPSDDGSAYTTFNLGSVGMAGMLHLTGHTAWIGYISVDDVDAHIEKIVEARWQTVETCHRHPRNASLRRALRSPGRSLRGFYSRSGNAFAGTSRATCARYHRLA